MIWKGLILAGGLGTRLSPLTNSTNKHLLPVCDKPMIYYPLTTLMKCGITDIVVTTSPQSAASIKSCLGVGDRWGVSIRYVIQQCPAGIADAVLAAESELRSCNTVVALGDNVFVGEDAHVKFRAAMKKSNGATIFAVPVSTPSEFAVVSMSSGRVVAIEEKPVEPSSNLAVPGLYFYDQLVFDFCRELRVSRRGEYEITGVNKKYLESRSLSAEMLNESTYWTDCGTHSALHDAGTQIRLMQEQMSASIGCPEEIGMDLGFVDPKTVLQNVEENDLSSEYDVYVAEYARRLVREKVS